jgi:hypothetical protein
MASNAISVSWGDHLEFGEGDGALDTPEAIARSVNRWHDELDAGLILWREARSLRQYARWFHTQGVSRRTISQRLDPDMDEHRVVIDAAHERGMKAYLYVTIFDEGWPLELSWRGGYETWQSYYVLRHPEHQLVDQTGREPLHGVLCYAYPEVRRYKLGLIRWLLDGYDWDGVFICTRSQSRPARHADQFGFNEPVVREYERRHGVNIREQDFDLDQWRRLHGEYLTQFLQEVKELLNQRGLALAVGIPRASYLGPPIGNLYLDWPAWVREGLVDTLVIDQVAAVCPSTWTRLWSGDQGYGYVQNYLTGKGMAALDEDVETSWAPVVSETDASLYLARMWSPPDPAEQTRLLALPAVDGLVFSSFRYDNPKVVERELWAM